MSPHCVSLLLRSCSLQPPAEKPETSEQSLSEIEMETFPFSVSGNYTIIVGGPRTMVSECVVQGVGSKRKKKIGKNRTVLYTECSWALP